jgi:hypothetical protein
MSRTTFVWTIVLPLLFASSLIAAEDPPGASIAGTVRYDDGTPAAGVRVATLFRGDTEAVWPSREAVTDARGRYSIGPLDPGPHWVTAARRRIIVWDAKPSSPDLQRSVTLVANKRRGEVDLVVAKGGHRISGTVVDVEGRPLAGAQVMAFDRRFVVKVDPLESSVSGPDGRFTLEDLEAAEFAVRATHPDTADLNAARVTSDTTDLRLQLEPAASVSGVVVRDDGTPVREFAIVALPVRGSDETAADAMWRRAYATQRMQKVHDENGRFTLAGLPRDEYEIRAVAVARQSGSAWTRIAAGETKEGLRIVIGTGARITGRVVDSDGRPVALVSVRSVSLTSAGTGSLTNDEGRFTLRGVASDPLVRVVVSGDAQTYAPAQSVVSVPEPLGEVEVGTIVLQRARAAEAGAGTETAPTVSHEDLQKRLRP